MVRDDSAPSVEARLERLERMVEELHRRLPPLSAPAMAQAAPAQASPVRADAEPLATPVFADVASDPSAWASAAASVPPEAAGVEPEPQAEPGWLDDERDFLPPAHRSPGRVRDGVALGARNPAVAPRHAEPLEPAAAAMGLPKLPMDSQFWLNKLGIGVFLLGVALLFRYSIEMGWVTPERRVAFGALLGVVLFGAGLRMDETRRRFVPVLLGGGIAVFYIVGFAAFNLYALVGYATAFAGMVGVTALAYAMALRKGEPVLAILGAIGGLGTPLVLGIKPDSALGFALYTSLILAWTSALYLMRGWKPVLWTSLVGGWLLLALYAGPAGLNGTAAPASDRWVLQAAVVFAWLACGVLPFVRELRLKSRGESEGVWAELAVLHWHGLSLLPPLMALWVTYATWAPTVRTWGFLALGMAALYQAAAVALAARDEHLPRVLALAASVFLAAGSVAAFTGEALLLVLAAEGVALLYLARRYYGRLLALMGHLLYAASAFWVVARMGTPGMFDDRNVWVDLAVVAAALGASFVVRPPSQVRIYRFFAHYAFLGWLWADLAERVVGRGEAATVAWAAYGIALFAIAHRNGWKWLERPAAWVGPLVVARFFLFDVEPALGMEAVLLCLAAEAVALVLLARRYFGVASLGAVFSSPLSQGTALAAAAHALAGAAAGWTAVRLLTGEAGGQRYGAVDLGVIAALLGLSFLLARPDRQAYRVFVHFAFLGWIWRELAPLPSGQGYATAAWAVYGVALLVVAMRRGWVGLERLALLTLVMVVAKLLLVDLDALEAIWRILLFLGIGGGFLFLSYSLQAWRRPAEPEPAAEESGV